MINFLIWLAIGQVYTPVIGERRKGGCERLRIITTNKILGSLTTHTDVIHHGLKYERTHLTLRSRDGGCG